jgi:hypothetical protein
MKNHATETLSLQVKRMKKIVIILSLLSCTMNLSAQELSFNYFDCVIRLKNAEALYLDGLFLNCIETIEASLDSCDLPRKDKEKALELLAKSYVETGQMEMAEVTVNLLLKNYPHYVSDDPGNPELFNRLVQKFKIHPLFTIGVKNTANWMRRPTMKVYSVLDGLDYSQPLVEEGYWFTYYGMAEYEFIDGLSANIDLMTFWARYGRDFYNPPGFNLSYWERDCYIEFPVYLKKYFHLGKNILVYGSGGFGVLYTYRAVGNVSLEYTAADIITGKNVDFNGALYSIDVLGMRNKFTGQWNAGVGIGYKLKNLRMFLDARYLGGVGSITAPEKAYLIPTLTDDYFYIDNKMKINQFEVGATISYTLFNSVNRIRK